MVKGNNSLKNKSHPSSKPYDVSNSFVRKITSRVSELLPQSTWLNRWLSPAEVPVTSSILNSQQHLSSIVTSYNDIPHASTSHSDLITVEDPIDHCIPTKRPRLPFKSQFQPSSFLSSTNLDSRKEEISPIITRSELLRVSPTRPGSLHKSVSPDFTSSTTIGEGSVALCDKLNGDDCSETSESTSGCSSLVPQAQSTVIRKGNKDINTSTQSQSIVPTRRTTKVDLSVLQRRRPVFNTTTFASPGRSMIRDQASISPFYEGRTMYGGAASNCALNASTASRYVGPKVKPVNSCNQNLPLSSTAKRILDALEQFSTPVLDAKLSIGSKRKLDSSTQRYSELTIPTTPDLLRVKRREKLLNSTRSARQMSATASSVLHYTSASEDIDNQYKLRKDDDEGVQYAGKVRGRCVPTWEPEAVKLPQIKLSLNSLPAIDIAVPPPSTLPLLRKQTAVTTKPPFVFAAPVMVESQSCISDMTSTYNFHFSSPLCVMSSKKSDSGSSSKKMFNLNTVPTKTFSDEHNHTSETLIKESDKIISDNKVAVQLNTNSKVNILDNKEKSLEIIPKENSVSHAVTVQNICTDNSAPCSLPNVVSDTYKKELFKKNIHRPEIISSKDATSSTDLWKCNKCCVQVVVRQDTTCSACQSASISVQSGFGDKFKQPVGSWKCQTCCIYNDKDVFECIACGTKKSSDQRDEKSEDKTPTPITGFGNMCKQPVGSWSCKECWSQNSSTSLKCAACETPKPGYEGESKKKTSAKVTFGSTSDNTGFVFGIDKAGDILKHTQTDNVVNLQNTSSNKNTANKTESTNSSGKGNSSFQFGVSKSVSGTTELNYTFGVSGRNVQLPLAQEKKESGSSKTDTTKPAVDTQEKSKLEDSLQVVSENSSQNECKKTEASQNSNTTVLGSVTKLPVSKSQETVSDNAGTVNKLSASSSLSTGFTFGSLKSVNNVESQNKTSLGTTNKEFVFGSAVSTPSSFQNKSVESTTTNIFSSTETSTNTFKFEPTKSISSPSTVVTTASVLTTEPSTTVSINPVVKGNTLNTFGTGINHEEKTNFFPNDMKVASFGSTGSVSSATFGDICKDSAPNNVEFKQQNFGTPANKELSANVFGSQTVPKSHVFGESSTSATTVPTFNLFGSTNTFQNTNSFPNIDTAQENKSAPAFTFGTPSNKENASTPGFTFSPVVDKPQPFGFTTPGNASNNGFAFNSIGTPSSTFSFTPKTETKTNLFNTNVPTFGSTHTNSASTFGIPQPTPAFGESLTSPSPVFTFGATSQPQQQPARVCAFPASQNSCGPAPTTGTPSFVFGSATASSTPTFDPNVKPTFNFTGGATPSFTAIAPSSSISQDGAPRKFRKAVRRQTQR